MTTRGDTEAVGSASTVRQLDWLERARSFALAVLVGAVVLAAVIPITMGVLGSPSADIGDGWCGTWTFRLEHADCPTCCEQFGAYRLRGQIVLGFALVGVVTWIAVAVARRWLGSRHADVVAEAERIRADRLIDQVATEHAMLTAQIKAFNLATADRSVSDADRRSRDALERQRLRVEQRLRVAHATRDELVAFSTDA